MSAAQIVTLHSSTEMMLNSMVQVHKTMMHALYDHQQGAEHHYLDGTDVRHHNEMRSMPCLDVTSWHGLLHGGSQCLHEPGTEVASGAMPCI